MSMCHETDDDERASKKNRITLHYIGEHSICTETIHHIDANESSLFFAVILTEQLSSKIMPMTIGLLPCQQESFEHHEELSKLSNETDVFYVPLQNDFTNHQDLSDLTKRFDEDILNKHLVVVSLPGKMIY